IPTEPDLSPGEVGIKNGGIIVHKFKALVMLNGVSQAHPELQGVDHRNVLDLKMFGAQPTLPEDALNRLGHDPLAGAEYGHGLALLLFKPGQNLAYIPAMVPEDLRLAQAGVVQVGKKHAVAVTRLDSQPVRIERRLLFGIKLADQIAGVKQLVADNPGP